MSLRNAAARPPRCTIVNLHTGEPFECLANPAQVQEKVQVNYARPVIQGAAHQQLHYVGTSNPQLDSLEFFLDQLIADERAANTDILDFRRFLDELTQPIDSGLAPPVALIVWPSTFTLEAVLLSVEYKLTRFAANGQVMLYTATTTFEQVTDVRQRGA